MCLHPRAVCPSLQPGAGGRPPAALRAVGSSSVHLSREQTPGLLTPLGARLGRKCGVGEVARRVVLARRPLLQPTQPQLPHRECWR